jgi:8-oxo-dGTP pyrophosphatase MutT (NUDIX family)
MISSHDPIYFMLETNLAKIIKSVSPLAPPPVVDEHVPKPPHFTSSSAWATICAGGIIYDLDTGRILVVKGYEKWSLPKGHREVGEAPHETAMREIYEETSLKVAITPRSRSKRILKCIYYPIMVHHGSQLSVAPIDTHEVSDVRWCSFQDLLQIPCNKQLRFLINHWDSIVRWFFTCGSYGYIGLQ